MATGLILVLIVGALGYLGIIYTSPALILLAICSGVMLFLGYGYILYMMLLVKCRDSDSDCYGRAGRRRYDLCGDGKPEQAAIAESSIPDGLPEFFWQEKKNIIHTGGSRCKEQQPDEHGGSSKKQWKLYIPAGSG